MSQLYWAAERANWVMRPEEHGPWVLIPGPLTEREAQLLFDSAKINITRKNGDFIHLSTFIGIQFVGYTEKDAERQVLLMNQELELAALAFKHASEGPRRKKKGLTVQEGHTERHRKGVSG